MDELSQSLTTQTLFNNRWGNQAQVKTENSLLQNLILDWEVILGQVETSMMQ